MFKKYYNLAKPGIVYGNLVTTVAGFFLGSRGADFGLGRFSAALAGISLVVASGCVFNNYIDRGIDALMERTKERELVKGTISGGKAIAYGIVMGLLGFIALLFYANPLAALVALVGLFFYVVMYSIWKRRSPFGTVVGSVSGAVPPVVGYVAASGRIDTGAAILFFILALWQMPHFYAIAIRRAEDYAAAKLPVMPLRKGIRETKVRMALYIAAFVIATILLAAFGYAGYGYLAVAEFLGLAWLGLCIRGFWADDERGWARAMFLWSLVVITGISGAVILRF